MGIAEYCSISGGNIFATEHVECVVLIPDDDESERFYDQLMSCSEDERNIVINTARNYY